MTETVTHQLYTIVDRQTVVKGSISHKHFLNCRPFFPKKRQGQKKLLFKFIGHILRLRKP